MFPRSHPYGLSMLAGALLYAVLFIWIMRYMRHGIAALFRREYRRYSTDVPFVMSFDKTEKERSE